KENSKHRKTIKPFGWLNSKNHLMKSTQIAIAFATIYLMVYALLCAIESAIPIAMMMFSISPFVVIGMVYTIIRYGSPSKHTFEDRMYEDKDS
ncbi:MAG: hypothetical protein ACK4GL_12745, partial [Flavobacteriales bacterium]